MEKIYQKFKGMLADNNMFHILYIFFLAIVFADIFCLMDTADKSQIRIVSILLAFFAGVFVESMDGRCGTKQLDETGVPGDEFSLKDLLYDAIGAVLAYLALLPLIQ